MNAPLVPFTPPAPPGRFWTKMVQGAQQLQFRAWRRCCACYGTPRRGRLDQKHEHHRFFRRRTTSVSCGWLRLGSRYVGDQCLWPAIFPAGFLDVQVSEKFRAGEQPRAAIVCSCRSGTGFCLGHFGLSGAILKRPPCAKVAVRDGAWGVARAFARRGHKDPIFSSHLGRRRPEKCRSLVAANMRGGTTHDVMQPRMRAKNPKKFRGAAPGWRQGGRPAMNFKARTRTRSHDASGER